MSVTRRLLLAALVPLTLFGGANIITLASGSNVITVITRDGAGNESSDAITAAHALDEGAGAMCDGMSACLAAVDDSTPQVNQVITTTGFLMVDNDTTGWNGFFTDATHGLNRRSYEGTPDANIETINGYTRQGAVIVSNAVPAILGATVIRYRSVSTSTPPGCYAGGPGQGIGQSNIRWNYTGFPVNSFDSYFGFYTQFHTNTKWPGYYLKFFEYPFGAIYIQPNNVITPAGPVRFLFFEGSKVGSTRATWAINPDNSSRPLPDDRWHRIEMYISRGQDPATFRMTVNGTDVINRSDLVIENPTFNDVSMLSGFINSCGGNARDQWDVYRYDDAFMMSTSEAFAPTEMYVCNSGRLPATRGPGSQCVWLTPYGNLSDTSGQWVFRKTGAGVTLKRGSADLVMRNNKRVTSVLSGGITVP